MKKLILFLLVLCCGCNQYPPILYKEKVNVISGFYRGQNGTVTQQWGNGYYVKLEDGTIIPVEPYEVEKDIPKFEDKAEKDESI
jgi:hypothetical protein